MLNGSTELKCRRMPFCCVLDPGVVWASSLRLSDERFRHIRLGWPCREVDAISEEGGKALRKAVIDHMMTFMEIFTARSNLAHRLASLWTEIHTQLTTTKQELQAEINRQLAEGEALLDSLE